MIPCIDIKFTSMKHCCKDFYQLHGKDSQLSNESLKFSILRAGFLVFYGNKKDDRGMILTFIPLS